ncbi:unnamed protein product [Rotaria sp. Silwood1]|nr:unnamed protein product [Rotaria sp. Silwood1]CAF1632525.1 unnamed protein product [Rotaria sp. Silwood1]CAF3533523.1 unnamed protein product [Rotaria sp. Silwood1]CAF3777428.1 unnamed protein product [Rotaria sp. Silwood1]CAF3797982.1 unnamed protein product [Rotaria sp. Silwood1]
MSSNDTSIVQLQLVTKYIAFAVGFPVLIIGIVGNLMNIIVFLSLGNYKTNASSFYMLAKSFFDLNVLIIGLIGHIIIQGFRSYAVTSGSWCRFRIPLLYINSLCSYTCLCLQSIDSFLCSSQNTILRQQSTVRRAHYLVIGFLFVWICNEAPYYFMQQVNFIPNWRCQTTNTIYAQYRSYFTILGLSNIIPILIISLFGYLSYRNMHRLHINQRTFSIFNRQTIKMALFTISIVLMFQAPYTIAQIYFTSTVNIAKSIYRQTQEQLANVFFFIYAYNTNASSFYCYCAASKRFRQQVLQVFNKLTINQRRNRIIPFNQTGRILTPKSSFRLGK